MKKQSGKKTLFQQVMKPKDWLALGILLVIFLVSWFWVFTAYQSSIDISQLIS